MTAPPLHPHHIGRSTIQSPEADRARAFAHHLQFAQTRTSAMTDTVKSADALLPIQARGYDIDAMIANLKADPKGAELMRAGVTKLYWGLEGGALPTTQALTRITALEADIAASRRATADNFAAATKAEAALAAEMDNADRMADLLSDVEAEFATNADQIQAVLDEHDRLRETALNTPTPAPQGEAQPVEDDDNPAKIWLDPVCGWDAPEGRMWHGSRPDRCDDCDLEPVEYIRADLAHPSPAPEGVHNAHTLPQSAPEAGDLISRAEAIALAKRIGLLSVEDITALRALPAPVSGCLMICDGCGCTTTDAELAAMREGRKSLISCCPERKMRPATRADWDAMRRDHPAAPASAGTVKPLVWGRDPADDRELLRRDLMRAIETPVSAWQPPPEDQRPEGYRCIVLAEVEWGRDTWGRDGLSWGRPHEFMGYMIAEVAPGIHGFSPIPAPPSTKEGGEA